LADARKQRFVFVTTAELVPFQPLPRVSTVNRKATRLDNVVHIVPRRLRAWPPHLVVAYTAGAQRCCGEGATLAIHREATTSLQQRAIAGKHAHTVRAALRS
jgi:hypothetical protein